MVEAPVVVIRIDFLGMNRRKRYRNLLIEISLHLASRKVRYARACSGDECLGTLCSWEKCPWNGDMVCFSEDSPKIGAVCSKAIFPGRKVFLGERWSRTSPQGPYNSLQHTC